jgi:GC-rich sequence DNA-binding factor
MILIVSQALRWLTLRSQFPRVEKLEDEHVSILKERHDMIQARRRAEDEDDLSLFLGSLPTLPLTGPEELDELGRIIPHFNAEATRGDRRTARAARRALRRRNGRQGGDEEGYSTDATLPPSDATDYRAALQQLSRQRDEILSDVKAKEFKDPKLGIGARFAAWRERFDDSYIGAWGGLALVGAWEFWIRLEMLSWNPFEVGQACPTVCPKYLYECHPFILGLPNVGQFSLVRQPVRVFPAKRTP